MNIRRIAGVLLFSTALFAGAAGCSSSSSDVAVPDGSSTVPSTTSLPDVPTGDGMASGSKEQFCSKAIAANSVDFSSLSLDEFKAEMSALREAAPDVISADVATLTAAMTQMQEDPSKVQQLMSDAVLEQSSQTVDTYISENCPQPAGN